MLYVFLVLNMSVSVSLNVFHIKHGILKNSFESLNISIFLIVNRKQNSHTRKALTTLPIRFQVYKDVETNGHCM